MKGIGAGIALVGTPGVAAAGRGTGEHPLVGTTAEYEVTSSLGNGSDGTRTQFVRSTVVRKVGGEFEVEMQIEENGQTTTASARVPLRALYPKVRGEKARGGGRPSHVRELSANGTETTIETLVSEGAYDEVTAGVESDATSGRLHFELLNVDGSFERRRGRALWLLPQFVSPAARSNRPVGSPVQETEGPTLPTADSAGSGTASTDDLSALATVTGSSTIITKDNGLANITTWRTNFDTSASSPGNYTSASPSISTNTSANWWRTNRNTTKDIRGSSATTRGNGRFEGIFPLGTFVHWYGWGHHTHIFYGNNQYVFVHGDIDVNHPSTGLRTDYKNKTFVNDYRSFGSSQSGKWYIV